MIFAHINRESLFTLYIRGDNKDLRSIGERSYLLSFEGVALVYYKYPHHRRAYIVRNAKETKHCAVMRLPNIRQNVGLIASFRGRKIDLLRTLSFNVEKLCGIEAYGFKTSFWQRMACLIDTYNGYTSKAKKSNIELLCRKYMTMEGINYGERV